MLALDLSMGWQFDLFVLVPMFLLGALFLAPFMPDTREREGGRMLRPYDWEADGL